MPSSESEESDWSSSDGESLVRRVTEGTKCTATYKGTKYSGKATAISDDVPDDIVPFVTADGVAVWCRDPGDGVLIALSRGECRKLAAEIIGKTAKSDSPTDSDIAACGVMFGTPFPIQMKPVESKFFETPSSSEKTAPAKATAEQSASSEAAETAASEPTKMSFKYNKQHLSGTVVPFTSQWEGSDAITAVSVDSKEGVYWITASQVDSSKHVAMTVTDAKRAVKSALGRAISADGPLPADDEACKEACGTPCPIQLHDARARNERAKQKRADKPAPSSSVSTAPKRKVDEVLQDSDMVSTKPLDASPEVEEPPAKKQTTSVEVSAPALSKSTQISVTLTGDAATLMPALATVFGTH